MGARADAEIHVGLRQSELAEEDLGHPLVVVLPGVHQRLIERALEGAHHRRRFHEVRACADDVQDSHLPSSCEFHELVRGVQDLPERRSLGGDRSAPRARFTRTQLQPDVFRRLDKHQPPVTRELPIDGSELAAKDAVDGNAERRCLAVHGAASAHDQVGEPDQVEAVQGALRNDDSPLLAPAGPRPMDELALGTRGSGQDDHSNARPPRPGR